MGTHVRLARTVAAVFDRMLHFVSHVPTWASPMGFVIGTDRSVRWDDPDPRQVDTLLARKTSGRFRMFDGRAFRGLMHPPKYLRDAIAAENTNLLDGESSPDPLKRPISGSTVR
jgi:spermidine synthase